MRSPDSKVHIGKVDLSLDYIILKGKKYKKQGAFSTTRSSNLKKYIDDIKKIK